MKDLFGIALRAAQTAGKYIHDSISEMGDVDYKGRANMVTDVDKTSENIIIEHIRDTYPDHSILAEESGSQSEETDVVWIIDPLDGTSNYVHGYPFFCVSIAVKIKEEVVIGVVYDPERDELFSAIKGEGAYLNQSPIKVSKSTELSHSLLSTGIPYDVSDHWHRSFDLFKLFYSKTHGIRRDGSAALDLCSVAAGRFDGYWEYDLNPWDVAAGLLIVREAGGLTTDFDNQPSTIHDGNVLVTNGRIHQQMLDVIRLVTR